MFYNPMDPAYVRDPYPILARMREQDPVMWSPAVGSWFLTRYEDMFALLRDPRALALPADQMSVGGQRGEEGPFRQAMRKWIVLLNPPDHTRVRTLLNKSFTPRVIARLHETVREIADELLEAIKGQRHVDLMRDYTNPLPLLVIANQLGVPRADRPRFKQWSDSIARAMDPIHGGAHQAEGDRVTLEMFEYLRSIAEERRRKPREDLMSLMVAAEEGGDRLSMQELLSTCMLLLFAGNETTTGLLGNAVAQLLRNRDQEAKLRARPGLMKNAVEEFLRIETPSHTTGRVMADDMLLGGKTLRRGHRVVCILGAANHDPAVFDDPDLLDVEREDIRHLAFGTGHHFCLGNQLARLEARVALEALLDHFHHFELSVDEVPYRASVALRGPKALPMKMMASEHRGASRGWSTY